MNATAYANAIILGVELEISAEFSVDIENDGIGSYEFWGQRGYDRGSDYPVFGSWDSSLGAEEDVFEAVKATLLARGWRRNRRFLKRARQLTRQIESVLENADPDSYFSESAIDNALEKVEL